MAPFRGERVEAGREQVQIEFFGLPGSGKTTIARELSLLLASHDPRTIYSPRTTRDHASLIPRTIARSLLIARGFPWRRADWHALRTLATISQRSHRDKAKSFFNYMTVVSLYRHLERSGCSAVVDQGVLQAIWSAHLRDVEAFSNDRWARLLFCETGTSRFYVCVQAPVSICKERLNTRNRKHSRMQSYALFRDVDVWEHAELIRKGVLDGLLSSFHRRGTKPRVLIVDGTGDPAELAATILTQILDAQARSQSRVTPTSRQSQGLDLAPAPAEGPHPLPGQSGMRRT